MVKKPKKGFTLVEMLVVVVIIAVLVSVVIPIINTSTIKARAAANASNLRSVEGQITMYMVMNEGVYDEFTQRAQYIDAAADGILGWIYDLFFGEGAAEQYAANYKRLEDNGNGEIPVPRGEPIRNVSVAKGLKAPNRDGDIVLVVTEGARMNVYITEQGAVASYGDWTKEDFADVAEDGIYDGTRSSSSTSTTKPHWGKTALCVAAGGHSPGAGCICSNCGGTAHFGADPDWYMTSDTKHKCDNGHPLNEDHKYTSVDANYHKCKFCGTNAELLQHTWNALGYCTADGCGNQKSVCGYNGCPKPPVSLDLGIVEGNVSDHCADHYFEHTCTMSGCTGSWRDGSYSTNSENCPNKDSSHRKCGYTQGNCTASIQPDDTDGFCSNHTPQICGANLNSGGKCSATKYGKEDCPNEPNHKSGCVTPDTLVTLADGSQKRIDAVTYNDYLLVWDFNVGRYVSKPAAALINMGEGTYVQTQLIFEDGTAINMLDVHGFFNIDENRFVFINATNVDEFVGDHFAKSCGNGFQPVKLVDYEISTVHTTAYSLMSAEHYNVILADVLTATPFPGFDNDAFYGCWPMGENMTYDQAAMQALINEHGLFTYEDVKPLGITYEQFVNTNLAYVKVIIGKGVITLEQAMEIMAIFLPQ